MMMLAASFISHAAIVSAATINSEVEIRYNKDTKKASISNTGDGVSVAYPVDSKLTKSGKTHFSLRKRDMDKVASAAGTDAIRVELRLTALTFMEAEPVSIYYDSDKLKTGSYMYLVENNGYSNDYKLTGARTGKIRKGKVFSLTFDADKSRASIYELVPKSVRTERENEILESLNIQKEILMHPGETYKLEAIGVHEDSEIKKIYYNCTSRKVAKVDKDGTITAKKKGTTRIKVTVKLVTGKKKVFYTKVMVE